MTDKKTDQIQIIHAGTRVDEKTGQILTSGGRVLGVLATGSELVFCYNLAMSAIAGISFDNCHYRKDIGHRVLKK